MKKIIITIIIIALIVVSYFVFRRNNKQATNHKFEFSEIKKKNIEISVSCTGTLEAIGTVDVGTELTGKIEEILVDFNDTVKKDDILAILDTTKTALSVKKAEFEVLKTKSEYELSEKRYADNLNLFKKNYLSEISLRESKTSLDQAYTNYQNAILNLDNANLNLYEYSIIRSPIDGTILHRNIEEGQTVSANLSAPVLFTVVENLTKMEIHALVDESDIGLIRQNQFVNFEVDSYSDMEFTGYVKQIRLQPEVVSNVVNYTVVIDAQNPDQLLLPGMTATVEIIIDSQKDVPAIENSVFRFTPDSSLLKTSGTSAKAKKIPIASLRKNSQEKSGIPKSLWILTAQNELEKVIVFTGISDGAYTEIISSATLTNDSRIIKKAKINSATETKKQDFRPRRLF